MVWKDRIDPELIDLFLDRVFEISNHSLFNMECIISDIALSGNSDHLCLCDTCSVSEEAERKEVEMEDEMDNLLFENDKLHEKLKNLKDEFTTLKNNSVIFSMEEDYE
jgi:hypothetical protein